MTDVDKRSEDEKFETLCFYEENKDRIKFDRNGELFIFLNVISNVASTDDFIDKIQYVRVYARTLEHYLDDNKNDDQVRRIENIENYLRNKVVVTVPFNVEVDDSNGKSKTFYVSVKNKLINYDPNKVTFDNQYDHIPVFSSENSNVNNVEEFEHSLEKNTFIGNIRNSWNRKYSPEAIVWKDSNDLFFFDGDKLLMEYTYDNGFKFRYKDEIVKPKLSNKEIETNFLLYDDVAYIRDIDIHVILDNDESKSLAKGYTYNEGEESTSKEVAFDDTKMSNIVKTRDSIDKLFNNFIYTVREKEHLNFTYIDLINFHNSIKSNFLTILAGISGTGKSKIITSYAAAILDDPSQQFNMISVRPYWNDDADLVGFVNTMSNVFNPGESGIVNTLVEAEKNPDKLYIIALDEMNLARIEHYFSQFLSVLENKEGARKIILYNESIENKLYNSNEFKHEINILNNVRFVGTMNVDESTFQISDKVIDRANIINLVPTGFKNRDKDLSYSYRHFETSEKDYDDFFDMEYDNVFNDKYLDFFDELNNCIQSAIPNVGIGWRTVNSIERFISNVSQYKYERFSKEIALDYQISQRILPKIRGAENVLSDIIGDENNPKSLIHILNKYETLSAFDMSKSILDKKKNEIKVMGYAN